MTAIEILRAASHSVPNEDYVQFMAAVDAVELLVETDKTFDNAFHFWMNDKSNPKALDALCAATDVRAEALANVGGA